MKTANEYNLEISGNFTFHDSQSGGVYQGFVYIAKNYSAKMITYDVDMDLEDAEDIKEGNNNPTTKIIRFKE